MKNMRKWTLAAMLVLGAALLGGCGSAQNVGILDANKVMTESPKVKQFQEQLNTKATELGAQLDKDKASMSPDEFKKRQETVSTDFMKTKQEMETQIDNSIKQALEEISKEKKLGVVLYKQGVAQGGVDITDDVIKKLQ